MDDGHQGKKSPFPGNFSSYFSLHALHLADEKSSLAVMNGEKSGALQSNKEKKQVLHVSLLLILKMRTLL